MSASKRTKRPAERNVGVSKTMMKTYWRARLIGELANPSILRSIQLTSQGLQFENVTWDDYWDEIPQSCEAGHVRLRRAWAGYIASGFSSTRAAPYSECLLAILRTVVRRPLATALDRAYLARLLGFETTLLRNEGEEEPFAAMTTTFRNPFFVSLHAQGIPISARGAPGMLPLVVCPDGRGAELFYHYRKQRIHANTDRAYLFFPLVDLKRRAASFRGLDSLTDVFVPQWDSRVSERAELVANKAVIPAIESLEDAGRSVRILDIGSGDGVFTNSVLTQVLQSGILAGRKFEPSLLDIVTGLPDTKARSSVLLTGIAKQERISSDYADWLAACRQRYDLVFIFRMLHNLSTFEIRAADPAPGGRAPGSRYPFLPHMNDDYAGLSLLFPNMGRHSRRSEGEAALQPFRLFNPEGLLMRDGTSLIARLCHIADGILIEDGDLTAEDLTKHLEKHDLRDIVVNELSRQLGLSKNHIYWIGRGGVATPFEGGRIWPRQRLCNARARS